MGSNADAKRIDVLRIEYGRRKLCQCSESHYEIDCANRLVYCTNCGAIVDPFDALIRLAQQYGRRQTHGD